MLSSPNILNNIDYTKRHCVKNLMHLPKGRLVVFGDSYGHINQGHKENWSTWVAQNLGYDLISYSYAGTSLRYSIQNFFNYYDTEYKEDDYIIFLITSPLRVPFSLYDSDASWQHAIFEFVRKAKIEEYSSKDCYEYFNKPKHKHFWDVYVQSGIHTKSDWEYDKKLIECFLENLKNKTLVLPCFPILNEEFALFRVSEEIENRKYFDETNHMSFNNLKILSRLILEYFRTLNYDVFSLDKFDRI